MLLRETIYKTKLFFHKRLRNFRSFFSGGYQKLPRSLSFNPFLCRTSSEGTYNEFYDLMQSDLSRVTMFGNNNLSKSKEPAMEDAISARNFMSFAKQSPQKRIHEDRGKEKKNKGSLQLRKMEDSNSQNTNNGARVLAKKMKELDMIDASDIEQLLDIEEALHYYSRLKSPVYLEIVDKFFMDIYQDLSVPQSSVSFRFSKGRIGSNRP